MFSNFLFFFFRGPMSYLSFKIHDHGDRRENASGKMLALHMADPGSIPGTPEGPLQAQLGVIPQMQSQTP